MDTLGPDMLKWSPGLYYWHWESYLGNKYSACMIKTNDGQIFYRHNLDADFHPVAACKWVIMPDEWSFVGEL